MPFILFILLHAKMMSKSSYVYNELNQLIFLIYIYVPLHLACLFYLKGMASLDVFIIMHYW